MKKRWVALTVILLLVGGVTWGFSELVVNSTGQEERLTSEESEAIRSDLDPVPERVTFESADGVPLVGWYWAGEGDPSHAVILVHGGRDSKAWMAGQAVALAGEGYAVLAPDLRNHGESGDTDAGLSLGIRESRDVTAAARFLADEKGARGIAVWGVSMGGASAIMAAGDEPLIGPLILESTSYDGSRPFAFGLEQMGLPPGGVTNGLARWFGGFGLLRMGAGVGDVVGGHLPAHDIAESLSPRPVMLIAGTADPIVPIDSMRAYRELFGDNAELLEIEGGEHGVSDDYPELVIPRVLQILNDWRGS